MKSKWIDLLAKISIAVASGTAVGWIEYWTGFRDGVEAMQEAAVDAGHGEFYVRMTTKNGEVSDFRKMFTWRIPR